MNSTEIEAPAILLENTLAPIPDPFAGLDSAEGIPGGILANLAKLEEVIPLPPLAATPWTKPR